MKHLSILISIIAVAVAGGAYSVVRNVDVPSDLPDEIAGATVFEVPQGGTGSDSFGVDALLRGNGQSAIDDTGILVDDSNNLTGLGTLNTHTLQGGTGTIALLSDIGVDETNSNIDFLTVTNTASLSLERALAGTANEITLTDNGANSNLVISIHSDIARDSELSLTASRTNWDNFYQIPSSVITAGASLSWNGNTLNYDGNHAAVTLAGTPNYLTISSQVITLAKLDISDDTNLTVGATGLTLTANDIDWSGGYGPILTASISAYESFYDTPSTVITDGDNISWSNNTLNVTAHTLNTTNSNIPFFTLGNTGSLSFERSLVGTANEIILTDNGANSTGVLSIHADIARDTELSLVASRNNWDNFYQAPSSVITAGASLSWNGNELNYDGNHVAVTLAGAPNYLTIAGQVITRNKLDISDDTNLTVGATGLTLTTNDIDWSGGYGPILTASISAYEGFYDVPSSVISAGTSISWSNNTLNVEGIHGAITLAGAPNYLTLSGQVLTLAKLDISDDTNMTAGTDLTLSTNDISLDSTLTQNFTFSGTNILFQNNASISGNLEIGGYASASQFFGDGQNLTLKRIAGSTFSNIQDMQNIFHSAGWVSGGGITDDGDGTITVAAGTGLIRSTNVATTSIFFTDWAAESGANVNLADNDISWVYAEYNSGSPQVIATTTELADVQTNILLAVISREGTTLHINETDRNTVGDHALNMIIRLKETMPYGQVSGGILSEAGEIGIALTAGDFWRGLTEFTTSATNTSTGDTFSYYYNDGSWQKESSQASVSLNDYNDFGTGLASLSNNKYGVHWVYLEADDEEVAIVYGIGNYTLTEAQEAQPPASVPQHLEVEGILAGKIIIKKGNSTFTQTESAFATTFQGSLASDHGNLAGLGDDDHTQYILVTGTRAFTGNQSLGGFDLTNIGNLFSTNASVSNNLEVSGTASASSFIGPLTGNATTATALAADPDNCSANQAAGGITANGTAEACIAPLLLTGGTLTGDLFGTNASLSVNLSVAGVASISSFLLPGDSGAVLGDCDNATTSKLLWDESDGRFSCGTDQDTGGAGAGTDFIGVNVTGDTFLRITSISFDPGHFNLSNTASNAFLKLDWTNGPASRSTENTWTALQIFSGRASVSDNLEVSGVASASNYYAQRGTNAAAAYSFADDTNTGIYSAANNTVSITVNGTQKVQFGASTTFIGTSNVISNQSGAFYMDGSPSVTEPAYGFSGDTNTGMYRIGEGIIGFTTDGVERLRILSQGASLSGDIEISGLASASTMYAGNIGISTTSPAERLHIVADSNLDLIRLQENGGSDYFTIRTGGDVLYFYNDQDQQVVTIGGTSASKGIRVAAGTAANPSVMLGFDADTGLYRISSDIIGFTTGGTERFRIANSGASLSGNFDVTGLASSSTLFGSNLSDCDNGTTSKLLWSDDGTFSCGTDQDSGTFTWLGLDTGVTGGTLVKVTSLSFNPAHFDFANTASSGNISIDWGAGGPASLSQNETITGNWVNTDNPWDFSSETNATATTGILFSGDAIGFDCSEVQGIGITCNSETIEVDWGAGGPASRSTANTWTALQTFSGSPLSLQAVNASVSGGFDIGTLLNVLGRANISMGTAAPVAYTRIGSTTTDRGLSAVNDLFVQGKSEFDDQMWLDASASVSANLEIGGYASVSTTLWVGGNTTIVGTLGVTGLSTLGAITATGVIDFGGATSVEGVNGTNPTVDKDGEFAFNTASDSFEWFSSGNARVISKCTRRPGYVLKGTDLTGKNQWSILLADEPYRIAWVSVTASGGNSLSWNLLTGSATIPATKVFAVDKQASGSAVVKYEAFTVASISDGYKLDIAVTSASATLDSVTINTCIEADTTD